MVCGKCFMVHVVLGAHSALTANSNKFEKGCRMIYAAGRSFLGLGLEDGYVPTGLPSSAMAMPSFGLELPTSLQRVEAAPGLV